MTSATKKKVISGAIAPRWPKTRVVRWLELGAIPALVGLWFPDWVGGYAQAFGAGTALPFRIAFPPLLTYVGAVILLVGCAQGIRRMGWHFWALTVLGALAVGFAGLSVALHFGLGPDPDATFALLVLSIGLAAFFASGVLWLTIAKVAEITTETRTTLTKQVVLAGAILGLGSIVIGAVQVLSGSETWPIWLRIAVGLFSVTFVACRYGVYCYKTQRSIGAAFVRRPEEQFWI